MKKSWRPFPGDWDGCGGERVELTVAQMGVLFVHPERPPLVGVNWWGDGWPLCTPPLAVGDRWVERRWIGPVGVNGGQGFCIWGANGGWGCSAMGKSFRHE